ncbi:MAG: glycoside hydrolase family 65 protein [Planctomycetes bacterium]|nr:glycoside hydrolase family 65 protein [Planctomycetota bacterium]
MRASLLEVLLVATATWCQAQDGPAPLTSTDPGNRYPVTLASGEFGATVPALGLWPEGMHRHRTILAGAFNGPLLNDDGWPNYQLYLPEAPAPAKLALRVGDVELAEPGGTTVSDYRQELDLARAALTTRFRRTTAAGVVDVVVEQLASRVRPALFATRVRVTAERDTTLRLRASLDLTNTRGLRWVSSRQRPAEGRHAVRLRTLVAETDACDPFDVEVAQGLQEPDGTSPECRAWQSDDRIWLDLERPLVAGQPRELVLLTSYRTSRRGPLPIGHDFRPLAEGLALGFDGLLAEHVAAWTDLWRARIEIDGAPELQRVADAALFHLTSVLQPGGDDSIGPMGLTKVDANNYAGHVFWDAETWMFPALLLLHPELARSMLEYRYRRLEGARQNAILKGVTTGAPWQSEVAYFPWESARTGQEACPRWFVAADEIHNNACIALAFWQFAQLHGDPEWIRSRAAPVTRGIAWFYAARAAAEDDGLFHLRGVTGADEYAEREDDFPYVNATARRALELAVEFAGSDAPAVWTDVARGLTVPFDPDRGIHPEFAGYDGRTIKQADVVLLAYPWGIVRDPARVRADLEYYAPRTARNAPAMSHAIHTILWAGLGDERRALAALDDAWRANVKGPFLTWSETPGNDCINFTTGIGGFLQALAFGFGGLRIVEGGLEADPLLPAAWRALRVRGIGVGDGRVDLIVTHDVVEAVPAAGRPALDRVRIRGVRSPAR